MVEQNIDTTQMTVSELENKFTPKKKKAFVLADSYERLQHYDRAKRVRECGSFLEWSVTGSERPRLSSANFCRDRLCPLCSWRRSYKIFSQVSKVMDVIETDYEFLFLTLTVPNVPFDELGSKISEMQTAFKKMMQKNSRVRRSVCGYFKALEVTFNSNHMSKAYLTFHPHFHVILAVPKDYFTSDKYINHDEWLSLWRQYMKDNSITQVDIRKCVDKHSDSCDEAVKSLKSAVAECAKYAVKASSYLIPWSKALTDRVVTEFLGALYSVRLVSFGGVFDKVRKQLKLDDSVDGDLVHVDNDKIRGDVALQIYRYSWSCGAYKLIAVENKTSPEVDFDE